MGSREKKNPKYRLVSHCWMEVTLLQVVPFLLLQLRAHLGHKKVKTHEKKNENNIYLINERWWVSAGVCVCLPGCALMWEGTSLNRVHFTPKIFKCNRCLAALLWRAKENRFHSYSGLVEGAGLCCCHVTSWTAALLKASNQMTEDFLLWQVRGEKQTKENKNPEGH